MDIIAEIGLNHCGSEERAQNLLQALLNTSVDAVTFQIRELEFYDQTHPRKRQLSDEYYQNAVRLAHKHHKLIGFAIAQPEKVRFLDKIGTNFWKTLSWDLTNEKLLNMLHDTEKKVYVSTGISGMDDIMKVNQKMQNIEFIHTQLTDAVKDVNGRAVETIRQATGREVAFGLHCRDHDVMFVVLGFYPSSIFFYVKDDTEEEHPDDVHALSIGRIDATVSRLKKLMICVGDGSKIPKNNVLHPEDDKVCARINAKN